MEQYKEIITKYLESYNYDILLENFPEMVAYTIHVIIEEGMKTYEEVKDMDLSEYGNTFTIDIPYELFDKDKIFFSNEIHYNQWSVVTSIDDMYINNEIDYDYHNSIFDYTYYNGKLTNIISVLDLYTTHKDFKYKYSEIIFKIINEAYQIYIKEKSYDPETLCHPTLEDLFGENYDMEEEILNFREELEEILSSKIDLEEEHNKIDKLLVEFMSDVDTI